MLGFWSPGEHPPATLDSTQEEAEAKKFLDLIADPASKLVYIVELYPFIPSGDG